MKLFNLVCHLRSRIPSAGPAVVSLVISYALRIIAWQISFYSRHQDSGIDWLFLTTRLVLGAATTIFYQTTRWKAKRNEQETVPIRLADPNTYLEPLTPLCGPLVIDDVDGVLERSAEAIRDIETLELDFQSPATQQHRIPPMSIDKCYITQIYPDSPWFLKIPFNALVPVVRPNGLTKGFGIDPRGLMAISERREFCINVGQDGPPLFYCSDCERHCLPRTKHCHDCGICVKSFDHHCPWFGICVSRFNMVDAVIYSLIEMVHCSTVGLGIADDIMATCMGQELCGDSKFLVVVRILGLCIAVWGLIFATVISFQTLVVIFKLSSTWEQKREEKPGILRESYDVLGMRNNWAALIRPCNTGCWWHHKTHEHHILVRPDGVLFGMPCPLMYPVPNKMRDVVKWEEIWLSRAMDD